MTSMPRKSPPKADEKPQFERFIEAAVRVGADETDERLTPTIQAVAPQRATPTKATKRKP